MMDGKIKGVLANRGFWVFVVLAVAWLALIVSGPERVMAFDNWWQSVASEVSILKYAMLVMCAIYWDKLIGAIAILHANQPERQRNILANKRQLGLAMLVLVVSIELLVLLT